MTGTTHYPDRVFACIRRVARFPQPLVLLVVIVIAMSQAAQAQTFSDIFDFNLQTGWYPFSGVTRDAAGNLYGTTSGELVDAGTVYELKKSHDG